MKKLKVWIKAKWHWIFAKRMVNIFQPLSIKYFSIQEQIAFVKGARELLSNHPKCEITLTKKDCDMLLNIEATLLQK